MHLLTFMCTESDNGSGMISRLFCNVFVQIAVGYRCFISKGLVELDDKVILEVLGNSSAIAGSIADDLVFFGNHLDI